MQDNLFAFDDCNKILLMRINKYGRRVMIAEPAIFTPTVVKCIGIDYLEVDERLERDAGGLKAVSVKGN